MNHLLTVVPDMPRNVTVVKTTGRSIHLSAVSAPVRLQLDNDDVISVPSSSVDSDLAVPSSWIVTYQAVTGQTVGPVTDVRFDNGMMFLVR